MLAYALIPLAIPIITSGLKYFVLLIVSFAAAYGWADLQSQLAGEAEQRLRAGDAQGGLLLLQRASNEPSTAAGEDRIGFLYASAGHQEDATAHFRKSIAKNPRYAPAHFHLGVVLWLAKDQKHGLSELQNAALLDPSSFDYRYRLGSAYIETGANGKALEELKAASALDGTKADVWVQLGVAQQRSGDLLAAVDSYAKAVSLAPKDNSIRNGYVQMLIATRQPERAIAESQIILADNRWDLTARTNIGHAYLKMGEFAKAAQAYRDLLEIDPTSVAGHYNLGIALKMEDQIEAAQKELEKSIELDPTLAESHYTLGITDWQLGDFPGTIAQMKAALALRPSYAEAHYMLGIALKQSGDLDGAAGELKESIKLDPSTPGPYNTLGQILRIKGDKAGSEEGELAGSRYAGRNDADTADGKNEAGTAIEDDFQKSYHSLAVRVGAGFQTRSVAGANGVRRAVHQCGAKRRADHEDGVRRGRHKQVSAGDNRMRSGVCRL
jgi:tetratricopeptide (TPR) repeat protein